MATPSIVLLDRGLNWGYRDVEPVGPFTHDDAAEAFAKQARNWDTIKAAIVLQCSTPELARKRNTR